MHITWRVVGVCCHFAHELFTQETLFDDLELAMALTFNRVYNLIFDFRNIVALAR